MNFEFNWFILSVISGVINLININLVLVLILPPNVTLFI